MKRKRIAAVAFVLLVLLPAGLYVTRNQWVAYALKQTVASRSQGQIALDFDKIQVGVFARTLTIHHPRLRFRNVYFDKTAGTMLDKVSFQRLVLTNIHLWDVLSHKQFIMDNLLLEKPEFLLGKGKGKGKKKSSGFDPASLIEVMQNHQVAQLQFAFLVSHTQIQFGRIQLNRKTGSDVYGRASYDLSIENMGTVRQAGDTLHPLFFDNLELRVRDFHRYSAPERLDIALDSAFYSSKQKRLFLNGLHVNLLDKNLKNPPLASLLLRWAAVRGMESRKQKKGGKSSLHLGEIKVVGGNLVLHAGSSGKTNRNSSQWLKNLFAAYRILSLDTLDLHHIHLFRLGRQGDTLMALHRLNLSLWKLWADSRILKDPVANLHFGQLQLSYDHLNFGKPASRFRIKSGKAFYGSRNRSLSVSGLWVQTRCAADSAPVSVYKAKKLTIRNLSAGKLQRHEQQFLALVVDAPFVHYISDSLCGKRDFRLPSVVQPLTLERLEIHNGKFEFRKGRRFALGMSGLDLFADSLAGTKLSGSGAALHYDSLAFRAGESHFQMLGKNEQVTTGRISFDNKALRVAAMHYARKDTAGFDSLRVGRLTLTHLRLNPLLFGNKLLAGGAYLYQADYSSARKDTLLQDSSLARKHWNHFVPLPFKTRIGFVRVRRSSFSLVSRKPAGDFQISSGVEMKLYGFKMGYDTTRLLSVPKHWEAVLHNTKVGDGKLTARSKTVRMNGDSGSLSLQDVRLVRDADTGVQLRLQMPSISFSRVNYTPLFRSDSLVFGKVLFSAPEGSLRLSDVMADTTGQNMRRWHFVFDSIRIAKALLNIQIMNNGLHSDLHISGLNLTYHPGMLQPGYFQQTAQNLMKRWDVSIAQVIFSDPGRHYKMVADRVALQSQQSRFYVKKVIGTNFMPQMVDPENKQVFTYFMLSDMSLNHMVLEGKKSHFLHVKYWDLPSVWINIISNDDTTRRKSLDFLHAGFFDKYTRFLGGIHVDSSLFKNVNVSYQYERMSKLVNIEQLVIHTRNIQLGKPFLPDSSHALFGTMFINLNDRAIISGDSLYTFRMGDVRINLPQRRIEFDSITLTPRFQRDDFFRRVGYQTDRITLYGKNAVLDNFQPNDLLNGHYLHFGKLQINNMSVRFERDKHYLPQEDVVKPMPIDMLNTIPYKFRLDSVQLRNSMISYFEYEVKSKNPAIFFIDHFNVLAQNVTNHLMPGDSNLILKFKGSGKLMKQADMDFTLVTPYFAPRSQWWFSAEAGKIDLTQFNPLTENALGLTIISGVGSLQVPMITGDDVYARGYVDFLYRKLKIRLYDRKKSQKSKSVISPFANFMMNSFLVKSNNPPFLGHVKKGVVYFERKPQKSFINYLWKSNLSGILSTIGINNKQQREVKREDKKQTKAADGNRKTPDKK